MGKKKKDESSSSSSSSSDDISTEETTNRRRRAEARRTNRKKEGKVISILTELKAEMCKQSKKVSESKDDTSEIRKLLEKLTENHNDQSKILEKLTESYNDLRKQFELHTNKGTSGDDSAASRSQSYHVQPPRYRLVFTSGVIEKIEKGQSIEISVALVDCNNNQTIEDGSLASATVELVVVNAEFNQHDNLYNWSREDFENNIKKARQANSATGDVDQSVKSIVSNGRFNLVRGVQDHSGSTIFSNSSNKKVRLGVMVVWPTEERVLEGLSNPFFVRGHDRPNRQCRLPDSRSNRQGLHNGYQEQNGPTMSNMQNPSWANSTEAIDEPLASDYFMGLNAVENNFFGAPGNSLEFNTNQTAFPVRLVWDRPNVEPRKRCFNLLDQLMPLYSCQRKLNEFVLPTMRLTSEKTHRRGGVLIEPLEADDSDTERPLKKRLHSKYRLRFVNKVCEAYYTMDPIKTDDENLIKVALFDENNTKITSGPLSSASVEVVVLHGDFNVDGQDYWTSEEFKRCVICPQPGKVESVLGGDSILVLDDGEACLGDAFFQVTSFLSRTGKFKMGVRLASTQDERIQEGISEPFLVKARHVGGLPPGFRFHPTDEELIRPCTGQPRAEASNQEAAAMSEVSMLNQGSDKESRLVLLPGFRFHPTDAEIIDDYLTPKVLDSRFTCVVVADVDLTKVEPWDLPSKAKMGEKEWYFFCHRDPKYLTGMRTNRATAAGYWKAVGKDKEIFRGRGVLIGMKKTLIFYIGRAPLGKKSPWEMHEYRLDGKLPPNLHRAAKGDWVLCRIFNKTSKLQPSQSMNDEGLVSQPLPEFTSPTDLPPGFRFFPTDKELIFHYLRNRATAASGPASIIAEVNIYSFEPWDLPGKATFGEHEWYFFCHRERKDPTSSHLKNRATKSGFWKATGTERMITILAARNMIFGFRKTLIFYKGRAPKGERTMWVMHEYRLADNTLMSTMNSTKGSSCTSSTRDEWLLCRIFSKAIVDAWVHLDALRGTPRDNGPTAAGVDDRSTADTLVHYKGDGTTAGYSGAESSCTP